MQCPKGKSEKIYQIQVRREILVQVEVLANSKEEAIEKYYSGDFAEEVVDSSDIGDPEIDEILRESSC